MTADVVSTIEKVVQYGVLGPLLVGAVWVLWKQQRMLHEALDRIREAQDKRAQDAQAVVDKLLELNNRWNDTIAAQTRFVEALDNSVAQLTQSVRENNTTLQELRVLLGASRR